MRSKTFCLDNRQGDSAYGYPEYAARLFLVLFLSLMDAVLTLYLVPRGAWEANPMMRYALERGSGFFIGAKYFLTAAGFLFLFRNGKIRIWGGRLSLEEIAGGLLLFYQGLVIYELKVFHIVF